MFSKTAARSKSYFLGLPAAAMAMGHSTVVQPFRRMRTKVQKTTAKFRRHTPLAPAIEDSAHNTAVLTPVLAPLSPLEIETWFRRSPSPPPPSSSASTPSLQNQSDSASASQRQDTEDFDAGSTSQVSGNPLWAQRFLPGLRIPNGFDMNNDAGAQSLSPISPVPSPSPLYPSNMISPMSFYSQDSIPQNDHFYSSTIDTTISLTTPITDIFTNTYMTTNSNENETDEDFTPYGYDFTNTQRFGGSEPIDHTTEEYTVEIEGETNNGSITRPFEFTTNNIQRFSGSEVIEYTIEGQYGTRLKELPAPRIHGMQDIDVLELGPPANAPTIVELPAETSLHHILSGQDFSVTINGPTRAESAFDDQAIDNIHRDVVNAPHQLARININVSKGSEELAYAGGLINDIFYVLQGCKLTPDQILVSLPTPSQIHLNSRTQPLLLSGSNVETIQGDARMMIGPSHAMLQQLRNIPPLVPWWTQGRMDVSQLSRLTLSYPLPLDAFAEALSQCVNLEEVVADWILPASSDLCFHAFKRPRLEELVWVSLASSGDLASLFDCVVIPNAKYVKLVVDSDDPKPHLYDICWEEVDVVDVHCRVTEDVVTQLRRRCTEAVARGRFSCSNDPAM